MQDKANTRHKGGYSNNGHIHRPHDTEKNIALSGDFAGLQIKIRRDLDLATLIQLMQHPAGKHVHQ